jgi:hypothetical protein
LFAASSFSWDSSRVDNPTLLPFKSSPIADSADAATEIVDVPDLNTSRVFLRVKSTTELRHSLETLVIFSMSNN